MKPRRRHSQGRGAQRVKSQQVDGRPWQPNSAETATLIPQEHSELV